MTDGRDRPVSDSGALAIGPEASTSTPRAQQLLSAEEEHFGAAALAAVALAAGKVGRAKTKAGAGASSSADEASSGSVVRDSASDHINVAAGSDGYKPPREEGGEGPNTAAAAAAGGYGGGSRGGESSTGPGVSRGLAAAAAATRGKTWPSQQGALGAWDPAGAAEEEARAGLPAAAVAAGAGGAADGSTHGADDVDSPAESRLQLPPRLPGAVRLRRLSGQQAGESRRLSVEEAADPYMGDTERADTADEAALAAGLVAAGWHCSRRHSHGAPSVGLRRAVLERTRKQSMSAGSTVSASSQGEGATVPSRLARQSSRTASSEWAAAARPLSPPPDDEFVVREPWEHLLPRQQDDEGGGCFLPEEAAGGAAGSDDAAGWSRAALRRESLGVDEHLGVEDGCGPAAEWMPMSAEMLG